MSTHSHTRPWLRTAALAAAGALLLSACSDSGGRAGAGEDADRAGGVSTEEKDVYLITHAPDGDTFWDYVRAGAEEAASQKNINLIYNNHEEGAEQAELIQSAIDSGADGIAVTMAKPEAMTPNVEQAVEAGIPVVSLNAGQEEAFDANVMSHFGQDDRVAGEAVGERLADDGFEQAICVIQVQGHIGLESRCEGVADHIESEVLYVEGTDMTQVASTVEAKLETTQEADVIIGLGAPITETMLDVVDSASSEIEVATFDLNASIVDSILEDELLFAVDQQPWLQGYLAVDSLWLHFYGGFEPGGGQPVLTGPAIVDADNAEAIQEYADENLR